MHVNTVQKYINLTAYDPERRVRMNARGGVIILRKGVPCEKCNAAYNKM